MEINKNYKTNIFNILNNIYKSIYNNDINELIRNIEELIKNKNEKYKYLNCLLNPDIYKYSKIPSLMPLPSCSFYIHNTFKFETNSEGYAIIMFNPFFLYNTRLNTYNNDNNDKSIFYNDNGKSVVWNDIKNIADSTQKYKNWYSSEYFTSFLFTNDSSINGNTEVFSWEAVNIEQDIPPMYNQYRLVSTSVEVRYIGNNYDGSGLIGGAIILENINKLFSKYYKILYNNDNTPRISLNYEYSDVSKYSFLKKAYNSYFYKENSWNEGLKMVYFPIDNSYEEFINMTDRNTYNYNLTGFYNQLSPFIPYNGRNGFNFLIYVMDGPAPYRENYKMDIYCNFECLPNAEYLSYMPTNVNNIYKINNKEKKEMINILQEKPIMKLTENFEYKIDTWKDDIKNL